MVDVPDVKPCLKCGETKPLDEFPRNKSMRDGRLNTCRSCMAAYKRARRADRSSNEYEDGTCDHCGRAYRRRRDVSRSRKGQPRYCSRDCHNKARVGRKFKFNRRWYAKQKLSRAAKGRRPRYVFYEGPCGICGERFVDWQAVTYCSPECSAEVKRAKRRGTMRRRKARKRGSVVNVPYRAERIHERDGWRCHLCSGAIPRGAEAPHPLAPTIDHLIPLADGGVDAPFNVATAHFLCNSTRGMMPLDDWVEWADREGWAVRLALRVAEYEIHHRGVAVGVGRRVSATA